MSERIAGFDVEHLHGPEEVSYTETELVVACVVRNGLPWVRSFLEHYFSMGVKHVLFLDNDSTDGTVDACCGYDGVTVLRTKAPFKTHGLRMRKYLIDRCGKGGWILFVDMDEHFDYPYSDVVALDSLLGYLNSKSYTAVTARMLDMFPEHPLSDRTHELVETWEREHRFYDISGVRRTSLRREDELLRRNVFDSDEVAVRFRGGVREAVFGFSPLLTKYPLTFSDGAIQERGRPHKVLDARIADLTCVLYHYKFYAFSLEKYWKKAIEQKDKENPKRRRVYEQYLESLEDVTNLQVKRESAKELSSVNELLENGFLVASEDYLNWVATEEERRLPLVGTGYEPSMLADTFLESRRQERAKIRRLGMLEGQIHERDAKMRELEERIREHRQELRSSRRTEHELTKKIGRLQARLRSSRSNEQGLARKLDRLEQQIEEIRNSRVWKLAGFLRRIKLGLRGKRSSSR